MGHLMDQFFGRLVLFQGCMVQLRGLPAQLLCHCGEPVCGGAESQECFVHRPGNGTQAAADQHKIAFVVHLRPGPKIAVRDTGQYLLDIGYVSVYAFQRSIQSLCHDLQLISCADGGHFRMQVSIGQGHHPVRYALHRMGNGTREPQDQHYGDHEPRQGGQN